MPAIIGLQAITHALDEIDHLPPAEYAPGVDRAAVGVRSFVQEINAIWRGEVMPEALIGIINDARERLDVARSSGVEFVFAVDPGVMPPIPVATIDGWIRDYTIDGELWLAPPTLQVRASLPVAFLKEPSGRPPPPALISAIVDALPACLWRRAPRMRQLYHALDDAGKPTGFLARPMTELPAGRPLLRLVVQAGRQIDQEADALGRPNMQRVGESS